MTEPLACVLHSTDFAARAAARWRFDGKGEGGAIRTAVVLGGGPAGQRFVQVLRAVHGFDGALVVSEPSPHKRRLCQRLGAIAVPPADLLPAVMAASDGRGAEYLVEATGAGSVYATMPALLRKQATVQMYGIGHGDAPMAWLNPVQWREATLVTSVGASGGFDADGRPSVYRRALQLLAAGTVQVDAMLTHGYHGLAEVPRAFAGDQHGAGYCKAVAWLP
jgi:L-iditol 2-dehydrogenase